MEEKSEEDTPVIGSENHYQQNSLVKSLRYLFESKTQQMDSMDRPRLIRFPSLKKSVICSVFPHEQVTKSEVSINANSTKFVSECDSVKAARSFWKEKDQKPHLGLEEFWDNVKKRLSTGYFQNFLFFLLFVSEVLGKIVFQKLDKMKVHNSLYIGREISYQKLLNNRSSSQKVQWHGNIFRGQTQKRFSWNNTRHPATSGIFCALQLY